MTRITDCRGRSIRTGTVSAEFTANYCSLNVLDMLS